MFGKPDPVDVTKLRDHVDLHGGAGHHLDEGDRDQRARRGIEGVAVDATGCSVGQLVCGFFSAVHCAGQGGIQKALRETKTGRQISPPARSNER